MLKHYRPPGMKTKGNVAKYSTISKAQKSRTEESTEAAEKKQKIEIFENNEKQCHDQLKMELQGVPNSVAVVSKKNVDVEDKEESLGDFDQITEDAEIMSKLLMSRKKRKLYEAMQIGKERKKAYVDLLKERKKKAEAANRELKELHGVYKESLQ